MQKIWYVLFIVMTAGVTNAYAADGVNECDSPMTQNEMNVCALKEYEDADKKLNAAYQAKMKTIDVTSRQALKQQQRKWLKTLKPMCKQAANDEAEGGSLWPLVFYGCMTQETSIRTDQIQEW